MKKRQIALVVMLLILAAVQVYSQDTDRDIAETEKSGETSELKTISMGSSLWVLLQGMAPGDPAKYGHFNLSYYITPKDVFLMECVTWTYYKPLGTNWDYEQLYPGRVQAFGFGIGYQRFLWEGLYTSVLATPFMQNYYSVEDDKISIGFQLQLQIRVGYRFESLNGRLFIEPSVAFNFWPVNTSVPASFEQIDNGTPIYKFEPGLHFGYRF